MKTMYIMCGLPGSGKSTWARKRVEKSKTTIVINKDAIRTMINGGIYEYDEDKEPIVKKIVLAIISKLDAGFDVVIDETNIKERKRQELAFLAHQYGYTPIIIYCKGNGDNLNNRMQDSRGITPEKWDEVIKKMEADFEPPVGNECTVWKVDSI
jgi:predicted kinase